MSSSGAASSRTPMLCGASAAATDGAVGGASDVGPLSAVAVAAADAVRGICSG